MQLKQHNRIVRHVAAAATVAIAAALIAVGAQSASAADQTVNVVAGEDLYDKQNVSINSGDTVTWQNDGVHDVKSARIPAGGKAWASPIQQGGSKFSTTQTAAGNYRYFCSLHSSAAAANAPTQSKTEMVGQFTVAAGAQPPAADPPAADPPAADPGGAAPQADPPLGPVASGGGSTAGTTHASLLMLGGGLLIAAMMSALVGSRAARRN